MAEKASWQLIIGAIFGGLVLLYLMTLFIVFTVKEVEYNQTTRVILISILSLGFALSAGFIGGDANIQGQIPFFKNLNPLIISAGGGIAVFIIIFILSFNLFPEPVDNHDDDPMVIKYQTINEATFIQSLYAAAEKNESYYSEVRKRSAVIAKQLERYISHNDISDEQFRFRGLLTSSYLMIALASEHFYSNTNASADRENAVLMAKKALQTASETLGFYDGLIASLQGESPYREDIKKILVAVETDNDPVLPYLSYAVFMANAVLLRFDQIEVSQLNKSVEKLKIEYLQYYTDHNPTQESVIRRVKDIPGVTL